MSQLSFKSLFVYTLVAVLAGAGVDAYLNLGDTFHGEICHPTDVDVVEFDVLAGSAGRFHITADGTLRPQAKLVDLTTNQVLFDIAAGGQRLLVPMTDLRSAGRYQLSISSADGSTGTYVMKTLGRINPAKLNFVDTQSVAAGAMSELDFNALAGYQLSANILSANSPARLGSTTLDGPDGPISLTGFITTLPDLIRIRELPLGITSLGAFTLKVENIGGTGDVKTHVKLIPTLDRQTIVEDPCN